MRQITAIGLKHHSQHCHINRPLIGVWMKPFFQSGNPCFATEKAFSLLQMPMHCPLLQTQVIKDN